MKDFILKNTSKTFRSAESSVTKLYCVMSPTAGCQIKLEMNTSEFLCSWMNIEIVHNRKLPLNSHPQLQLIFNSLSRESLSSRLHRLTFHSPLLDIGQGSFGCPARWPSLGQLCTQKRSQVGVKYGSMGLCY